MTGDNTSNGSIRAHSKIVKRNIGGFARDKEAAAWIRQFGQYYPWWSDLKQGQRVPDVEPNDIY